MKTDQRRLVWGFIGSFAVIAATVGVATVVARWAGLLG